MYAFFVVIKNVIYAFWGLKKWQKCYTSKCHICTLRYSKYVPFDDNLAINSIIAKILKKCKQKSDKNLGYDYVNRNQESKKRETMIAMNISL